MRHGSRGPAVHEFWKAWARGENVDVEAMVQQYPNEAVELADALWEAARLKDSMAKERMWLARAQVLRRSGEEETLGTLLRSSRENAGLSAKELSSCIIERGVSLPPMAIHSLESDRVKVSNVKTPGLWLTLTKVLQIDPHRLVAMIRDALSGRRTEQRFTRMERGTTDMNRRNFLGRELPRDRDDGAGHYISWVRTELGLPSSPTDSV